MRPKLTALLAVPAIALVGCSAAEPEPAPTVTVTATPEAEPTPEAPASPTEAYLESAQHQISQHAEYFDAELPAELLSDESLIERGEDICERFLAGELRAAPEGLEEAESELEKVVRGPAIGHLCTPESN